MREIEIYMLKKSGVSIEALYGLYQQSFQQWHEHQIVSPFISKTFDEFRELVERAMVFVALDVETQELLGMHCFYCYHDMHALGFFLAISSKAKHQGIASRMLEHEIVLFRKHGYRFLKGNTLAAATWSVRWHRKNGYYITGYTRNELNNYPSYQFRKQIALDVRRHPGDVFWLPGVAPLTACVCFVVTYIATCVCKTREGKLNWLGRWAKRVAKSLQRC